MDFDPTWLLVGLPLAFALGWLASRADLRQLGRQRRDPSRTYHEGLNLLLNEKPDEAIDAFIAAVQLEPDTAELHFALGSLFRRRGEFERALRVHEHLAQRADLSAADRARARRALAQDYMKAGLFDRAEAAWRALLGGAQDADARQALLSLAERAHDWPQALEMARRLEASQPGAFAARIAHHECEQALLADAGGQAAEAEAALERARAAAPQAPRPLVLAGERAARAGDPAAACAAWDRLREVDPAAFLLVAGAYAEAARRAGLAAAATAALQALHDRLPAVELLQALRVLADSEPPHLREAALQGVAQRLRDQLARQPSLGAAQQWLELPAPLRGDEADQALLQQALARAGRPLQRYRCAACGFEAERHFWQCPGCLSWESFPPRRIEAL